MGLGLKVLVGRVVNYIRYKQTARYFGRFGRTSFIRKPYDLDMPENIYIGEHVYIKRGVWLGSVPLTGNEKSQLIIEDGCTLGRFNHIFSTNSIIIEKNVLTADKVYISDNLHGYEDISTPIIEQCIVQKEPVVIGEGSWIGENVCVIGASIGKHCVIGSNAVVTHDIPDFSVAVGAPAKVIKRYDIIEKKWEKLY